MPPRYTYWTIILDGQPTAFRARERDDLEPTLRQLRGKNPDAVLKWFAHDRLWESPEEARQTLNAEREARREKRSRDWRPGGEHVDRRLEFARRKREERREKRAAREERQRPPGAGDHRRQAREIPQRREQRGSGAGKAPWRPDDRDGAGGRRPWPHSRRDGDRKAHGARFHERDGDVRRKEDRASHSHRPWTDRPWAERPWADRPLLERRKLDRPQRDRPQGKGQGGNRRWNDLGPGAKPPWERGRQPDNRGVRGPRGERSREDNPPETRKERPPLPQPPTTPPPPETAPPPRKRLRAPGPEERKPVRRS